MCDDTLSVGTKRLNIVSVDDECKIFELIRDVIGTNEHLHLVHYANYTELVADADIAPDVFILDIFFDNNKPDIYNLLRFINFKWPSSTIIVLTNYGNAFDLGRDDNVFVTVLKSEVYLNPSLLRMYIIHALRENTCIDRCVADPVIAHLKMLDLRIDLEPPIRNSVCVGNTRYRLLGSFQEIVLNQNPISYTVDGFNEYIVGCGETLAEARKDFDIKFHEAFQEIFSIRPGYRDVQQDKTWKVFVKMVDLDEYHKQRSIIVPHSILRIKHKPRCGLYVIEWSDSTTEEIDADNTPYDFAALKLDRWLLAVIQRNMRTNRLEKILYASYTRSDPIYDHLQRSSFWNQP